MAVLDEQETTISLARTDDVVRIWTSDLRHLRKLRQLESSRDELTEVAGGDDWGQFECRIEGFHLFSAIRRKRTLSPEDRAARVERLRELRRPSTVDETFLEREGGV